jgi:hypothetical protein
MKKDQGFENVRDIDTLTRLARSSGIRVLNRFEYFEAVNGKNGHRYKVQIRGQDIICSCPDAKNHHCKHEIAVARDNRIVMFMHDTDDARGFKQWHEAGVQENQRRKDHGIEGDRDERKRDPCRIQVLFLGLFFRSYF